MTLEEKYQKLESDHQELQDECAKTANELFASGDVCSELQDRLEACEERFRLRIDQSNKYQADLRVQEVKNDLLRCEKKNLQFQLKACRDRK